VLDLIKQVQQSTHLPGRVGLDAAVESDACR
jgi:hypothetical protein